MKKIDKLILKAFLGPFFLTFVVVVFILLIQYLIKYFPDLVGKGLGINVFGELIFYFSVNVTPMALPLAILLSSLIAFGNLGEHFELTAIKSAGISMIRVLTPIFIFSLILCIAAFFINNNLVPKANLKAFSLLYDVRQKKPTFDFKEGNFYNGLPGYSIKVNKKYEDGKSMKDIMIYNHSSGRGNTEIVMADSAQMYMMLNDTYLVMELVNGKSYTEMVENQNLNSQKFLRNDFEKSKLVFSLESFNLQRTQEELFASNKIMRNVSELTKDVDSLNSATDTLIKVTFNSIKPFYNFSFKEDTIKKISFQNKVNFNQDTALKLNILKSATNSARSVKVYINSQRQRIESMVKDKNSYQIELYKKFTLSFACLVMFLIGAPLGSIIKKGGLGMPVIISIIFFITYYIISMITEKWAKEGIINITLGIWFADLLFLPIGFFFLRQARNDSRILETDYFVVMWSKVKQKIFKNK